jgi:hypothetical protein
MASEIPKNVCEICGQKATAVILDNEDTNHSDRDIQIRIRYSCLDHYLKVHQKIPRRKKEKEMNLQNIRIQVSKMIERFLYFAEDHKKGEGNKKN